jgi:hypothetical protein
MTLNGWHNRLRRVAAVDRTNFLYYSKLICNKCNGNMQSLSKDCLSQLGPAVTDLLPYVVTRKGVVEKSVLALMQAAAADGVSFTAIADYLSEVRHEQHDAARLAFAQVAVRAKAAVQAHVAQHPDVQDGMQSCPVFDVEVGHLI